MPSLLPTPDTPHDLCEQVTTALRDLPAVRRIIAFGSLATGAADAFSDVDMLIVCNDLPAGAWAAARAIRSAKPVQFYRMFSSAAQPAGRYWFADQSPLTRLDISFHTEADYQHLLATGRYLAHPLHTRELHVNPVPIPFASDAMTVPLIISEAETHLGERIYRIVRAIKHTLRNQPFRYTLSDCIAWLETAVRETRDTPFVGGDPHALAAACLQLANAISTKAAT